MSKKTIADQRWEIYEKLFGSIKEYMNLGHWDIGLNGTDELEGNTIGRLEYGDYSHLNARILFSRECFFKNNESFEEYTRILIHEICHIFAGTGRGHLEDDINNQNLSRYIGRDFLGELLNTLIYKEESMVNLLDKVIFKGYKLTDDYKRFEKLFNKIDKVN